MGAPQFCQCAGFTWVGFTWVGGVRTSIKQYFDEQREQNESTNQRLHDLEEQLAAKDEDLEEAWARIEELEKESGKANESDLAELEEKMEEMAACIEKDVDDLKSSMVPSCPFRSGYGA